MDETSLLLERVINRAAELTGKHILWLQARYRILTGTLNPKLKKSLLVHRILLEEFKQAT